MINRVALALVIGSICFVVGACSGPQPETTKPGANSNAPAASPTSTTPAAKPVGLSGYSVEWLNNQIPSQVEAGKGFSATITLRNPSSATWPARGTGSGSVTLSYHWLPAQGDKPVVFDGERTTLPHDVAPGETITLNNVLVVAPPNPGSYRLHLSLVHEGATWFDEQGAKSLTVPVTVR